MWTRALTLAGLANPGLSFWTESSADRLNAKQSVEDCRVDVVARMQLLKRVVAYLFGQLHVVNDDLPTLDSLTNLGWSAGVYRILWR